MNYGLEYSYPEIRISSSSLSALSQIFDIVKWILYLVVGGLGLRLHCPMYWLCELKKNEGTL